MGDSFTFYTLLALLGCILAGLFFAWLLYSKTAHLSKNVKYTLAAGRALIITLIAFLLFFPLLRSVSYQLEKPIVIIGQDNSISAGKIKPAGFNTNKYEKDLKELSDRLSEKYEVSRYNFSDSVNLGFDFSYKGKITNASKFVTQLNDELLNRNVGAIILATDGIFNRGGSPLYDVNKLKAPVYTIALGDTVPKKDLIVANVNSNDIVYLDNEFTVEVQVQAFESKGATAMLRVQENGKAVTAVPVQITSNTSVKIVPLKLKATKLGLQRYTISLGQLPNEVSNTNNTQHIFIDVIDAKQKVLIATAAPHPDIAIFKQAISANKHYEVKVVIGDELNAVNLKDYGLVILYQLPSIDNRALGFLSRIKQSTVSVWYVLGAQSNLGAFNQMQKGLSFTGNTSQLQEIYSDPNPNFTAFDIGAVASKTIENFDPLLAPFGNVTVNTNATIALNQRIGKIKTQYPQLIFINEDGRKTAYLIGEGIWRWKLSEALNKIDQSVVGSLISNSVQYLSLKDDKRKFKVYTTKNSFDENESVLINAALYNDSYMPVNTPDVSVQVKNETGKSYSYLFSRTETGYQLDAGALPPGKYNYTAGTKLGDKTYNAGGLFYINNIVAEYQQTVANHELLGNLSTQTNGKMYMPNALSNIYKDIINNEQIKTLTYEDRRYEQLINYKCLFALIIALLSVEWFFRKRNGEV
ncbi:hypothetical protein ACVWYN_002608 [Pedobacter sp. UYP24]